MSSGDCTSSSTSSSSSSTQPPPQRGKQVCGTYFDVGDRYELLKPIGHGAYGVVCAATDLQTGEKVAIKKITKSFSNLVQTKRTLREVKILRHFDHDNVIRMLDILKPPSYDEFEDLYIVSELMNTDLHQIIVSNQPLSDEHVQYFIYQILRGLKYIHSADVLHRDLKPSNLLLNANCDLKICDFGLSRVARPEETEPFLTEYVATRWYRAPEIMLSWKEYTKAIDVWSVGCILAEIFGHRPLFPGKDYMHQLHLIISVLGSPSYEDTEYILSAKAKAYVRNLPPQPRQPFDKLFPSAPPAAVDLLTRMLTFAPEKRITVDEALRHPYIALLTGTGDGDEVMDTTEEHPTADEEFNFDFEKYVTSKDALKSLLWQECCHYNPELASVQAPKPEDFIKPTVTTSGDVMDDVSQVDAEIN